MRCVGRGDFDVLCCAVLCSRYCYRHSSTTYALTTLLVATMLTAALRLRSEMAALHQRTLPITSKTNNEHCPEYLPHCWLDGLEAHLLDVCSSAQPTTIQLSRLVFFRYCLFLVIRHPVRTYVRTTHYLTYNHPTGPFVPYVQSSYFHASLRSPWYFHASLRSTWKYYALYFAFELCQINYIPPLARRGGGRGKPQGTPSSSPVSASVHTQVNYDSIRRTLHVRRPPTLQ